MYTLRCNRFCTSCKPSGISTYCRCPFSVNCFRLSSSPRSTSVLCWYSGSPSNDTSQSVIRSSVIASVQHVELWWPPQRWPHCTLSEHLTDHHWPVTGCSTHWPLADHTVHSLNTWLTTTDQWLAAPPTDHSLTTLYTHCTLDWPPLTSDCLHSLTTLSLCLHSVQAYFWKYYPESGQCTVRPRLTDGGMASVWSIWSWVTELSVFGAVPLSILALNVRVISETRKISARELQLSSRLLRVPLHWIFGQHLLLFVI